MKFLMKFFFVICITNTILLSSVATEEEINSAIEKKDTKKLTQFLIKRLEADDQWDEHLSQRNFDYIKMLIENGADLNGLYDNWATPLMRFFMSKNIDENILKLMLSKNINLDIQRQNGDTALMIAIANNYFDFAKLLIEAGADVNAKNDQGSTALDTAIYHFDYTIPVDGYSFRRPYISDSRSSKNDAFKKYKKAQVYDAKKIAKLLIAKNAQVGKFVFNAVADEEVLYYSLKSTQTNADEILHNAVSYRINYDKEMIERIINVYKKLNIKFFPKNKISKLLNYKYIKESHVYAESTINDRIYKLLLLLAESGIPLNEQYANGYTILIWATKNNFYKLVKVMIENGADISIADDYGYTAKQYAENNNNKNIIALFSSTTSGKQTGIDKILMAKKATLNYKKYALIIGINKYLNEPNVAYADNSARSFKLLAKNVLGVPEENIILLENEQATSGQIKSNLMMINELMDKGATLYFFYAGHGVPGKDGKTYILSQDMKAHNIHVEQALAFDNIYKLFAKSKAEKVYSFVDTCFSGKDDSGALLYKGVAPVLRVNINKIDESKLKLFTAGSSKDFANQYESQEQRMFSYFLIKGLAEGKTDIQELQNYVMMNVKRNSIKLGLSYKQVPQFNGKIDGKVY